MAKFSGGYRDHAGFTAIKGALTAQLAAIIEMHLQEMGEDAQGISWFSSNAEQFAQLRQRQAA